MTVRRLTYNHAQRKVKSVGEWLIVIESEDIKKAIELLREAASPRKIILFGSYATGDADDGSDVDLLVVEDQVGDVMAEMVRLRRAVSPLRIPADVVVVSEAYYNYWSDTPGNLMFEVALEGEVLYEAA